LYGESLLSKIIDNNDVASLRRLAIDRDHFATEGERKAYDFLQNYAQANRNQAPDYRTFAAECPDITYQPNVEDSFEYLARKLKDASGKRLIAEFLNGQGLGEMYEKNSAEDFIIRLTEELEKIKIRTRVRTKVGTDAKRDTNDFLAEYRRRKDGQSFKRWASAFPSINEQIGAYASSNMYTWYGRSGRGKSVFTLREALATAMQGANVLIWAMEMGAFEVLARLYSMVSAIEGVVPEGLYDGVDMDAGFESNALLYGKLSAEFESGFEVFLSTLSEIIPGNITIRAVDDEDFNRRDLRTLEADIIETNADVVVLDPFYYLDYENNTSKTAGGDAANTSKRLRHLAGRTQTVIHVITQAEEVKNDRAEDGQRELKVPTRAEIKKTKAVLEDAANVFAIDTLDGQGLIEIEKGRSGGEGTVVEITYLPNYGIVNEVPKGEASVTQFTKEF
jgi:hypothetical protein